MGRDRYKIYEQEYPYFITSSVVMGLPIFSEPSAAQIVLDALVFLQDKKDTEIIAYVIMENHIHAILYGEDLAVKIGYFKSYTARSIIDLFKKKRFSFWLKHLRFARRKYKKRQVHQLWEEGFHPKQIIDDRMMIQKIEYIHNNPVKRGYVGRPEDWRYSSARNYLGEKGLIPVKIPETGRV